MYTNQFEDITQQNDIYQLLNFNDNPQTAQQQEIKVILNLRSEKVQKQILNGQLNIFDPHKIKDQILELQKERMRKQKQLQCPQVQKNELFVRQLKREIIKLRQEQGALVKQEAKLKKKEILEQIKKWEQVQTQIKVKKEEMDMQQQRKQNQQRMKLQKELQQNERKKKNQKKKKIQKSIKEIEKNREKRLQILKFAELEYQKLNPKYLQIQKKYQQMEKQTKFEEDILKKNHSLSFKFDYTALKKHEQEYMSKVQERNKKKQSLRASSVDEKKNDFTPFLERDQKRIEEEKLKFKRRQDFVERLKEIPIHIDPTTTLDILIKKDKDKNPLKYNFLGEKHLTNQQIFKEFPNFQMNIHPKEVGSEYLRQLPVINEHSRVVRSQSESGLITNLSERIKYKDYLNDLKASRPTPIDINEEELLKSNESVGNKRRILELLAQREKKYNLQLKRRQEQCQKFNTVKTTVKKTKQMDELYSKSLKAKLARLEINT